MSSADDVAALMHELVQRQAAIVQRQAALVRLQTESVRLQRLLIDRVLGASTLDPDMTPNVLPGASTMFDPQLLVSNEVQRDVLATGPAGAAGVPAMGSCAKTRTWPAAKGPPREPSLHVVLALAYLVALQADLGAVDRAALLVGLSEGRTPLEEILLKLGGPFETALTPGHPTATRTRAMRCLTAREREVAMLIAKGLTNRQIAARLVIAERTGDTHVQNLLAKLGCASRSQVAAVLPTDAEA